MLNDHIDVDGQARRFADFQYGVVAGWQLRAVGATEGQIRTRIRAGRLIPILAGVYALGHAALGQMGIWMAATLAAGPGALLSHQSAAALWGFARPAGPIHVIGRDSRTSRPRAPHKAPSVQFHRTNFLHEEDRATCRGVSLTSVARTFTDIAGSEPEKKLQIMVNEATRSGLLDIRAMRRILLRTTGKRGIARLERILKRWHPLHQKTKSELEDLFLELCRLTGLPEPRVNEWVLDMKVDFWWPGFGLIVELDSRKFHDDERGHEQDRARTARLELAGYRVLRLTWAMVTEEPEETIRKVRRYFQLAQETATSVESDLRASQARLAGQIQASAARGLHDAPPG